MHFSPTIVLAVWIPAGIYLFHRYPARIAILANFFVGWGVLPGAHYIATTQDFPYWILGVCLPTDYLFTKAAVTGLAALVGIVLFRFADLKKFRAGLCDLPMAVWCCVPLLSAATHRSTFPEGFRGAAYQTICWGVPWVLGRIYFSDHDSLLLAARACVIAGICYVPICLVEICIGPQLYAFLYGYQPYRWVGAERYLGFRPIGLLEDGNQLGIWMAAATLIAVALYARRLAPRALGLPMGWAATLLAVTTLLCQSVGSVLLLLLLLPFVLLQRRSVLRRAVAVLAVAIVGFALFQMTDRVSLRAMAQHNGVLHSLATALADVGRQSLAWRISHEESQMTLALQKPLLGFGKWNWWQDGTVRPWSLWLLVFGMYGVIGLMAFGSILFLPVLRAAWPSGEVSDPAGSSLRLALVALILMVAIDNLLNGAMILPYLLLMGGLATDRASQGAHRSGLGEIP
jgi:hypothetical protein